MRSLWFASLSAILFCGFPKTQANSGSASSHLSLKPVSHYSLPRLESASTPYLWRSDHEVLYWEYLKPFPHGHRLVLVNLKTGKRKQISKTVQRADEDAPNGPLLSPNKKWLLLIDTESRHNELQQLPRRRRIELPETVMSNRYGSDLIHWTSDSRHWVLVGWKQWFGKGAHVGTIPMQIMIGDSNRPDRIRRFDVAKESPLNKAWPEILRATTNDLIVWMRYERDSTQPQSEVVLTELDMSRHALARREWKIRLPFLAYIHSLAFSPNGKQLLWQLSKPSTYREVPRSLWLSWSDGTDMKELKTVSLLDSGWGDEAQWLPSGRQISVLDKNDLLVYNLP